MGWEGLWGGRGYGGGYGVMGRTARPAAAAPLALWGYGGLWDWGGLWGGDMGFNRIWVVKLGRKMGSGGICVVEL